VIYVEITWIHYPQWSRETVESNVVVRERKVQGCGWQNSLTRNKICNSAAGRTVMRAMQGIEFVIDPPYGFFSVFTAAILFNCFLLPGKTCHLNYLRRSLRTSTQEIQGLDSEATGD
jgi:hypothetical protein